MQSTSPSLPLLTPLHDRTKLLPTKTRIVWWCCVGVWNEGSACMARALRHIAKGAKEVREPGKPRHAQQKHLTIFWAVALKGRVCYRIKNTYDWSCQHNKSFAMIVTASGMQRQCCPNTAEKLTLQNALNGGHCSKANRFWL